LLDFEGQNLTPETLSGGKMTAVLKIETTASYPNTMITDAVILARGKIFGLQRSPLAETSLKLNNLGRRDLFVLE
jgi:hypothetical protein